MRYATTGDFDDQVKRLPTKIRLKFLKQLGFLLENPRHPSLQTKKYGGTDNVFQARVDQNYRFYFAIKDGCYILTEIKIHPK